MLDFVIVAALAFALQLAPPPVESAPSAKNSPPTPASLLAARLAAEETQLALLMPAPLAESAIRAMAQQLGAASDSADTVQAAIDRYQARTKQELERTTREIRPRLTSAYRSTPGGALDPAAGPELVAVLQRSGTWRTLLAEADAELLRALGTVRTDQARTILSILTYQRTVERDEMASVDPAASIRLPALLDAARLDASDRRRVEESLDRQWARCAAAIAARRRAVEAIELQRATLLESWGPAWEMTASEATMAQRQRKLAELDARVRASEEDLRATARGAATDLLRALPPEPASRVRAVVDSLMWPELFLQEALLAQAVARSVQGADPALLPAMQGALLELQRRLESTRKELARRASRAEDLDATAASVELGAAPEAAVAALAAQLELQDIVDRRRKLVRDSAVQLSQMAVSSAAPNAAILQERVAGLDADARASQWRRSGIAERMRQLADGERDKPEPAPPATSP